MGGLGALLHHFVCATWGQPKHLPKATGAGGQPESHHSLKGVLAESRNASI
jgi:hypothetical protein